MKLVPPSVHGFVPDVYAYMLASDLIVTKPGALTVSEAIRERLDSGKFSIINGIEESK